MLTVGHFAVMLSALNFTRWNGRLRRSRPWVIRVGGMGLGVGVGVGVGTLLRSLWP